MKGEMNERLQNFDVLDLRENMITSDEQRKQLKTFVADMNKKLKEQNKEQKDEIVVKPLKMLL